MNSENSQKILLVEDDDAFRISVARSLNIAGYEVIQAGNGKSAYHMMGNSKYDLVISDIKMPDMNGIELLHRINRSWKTPVILMTGFNDVIEAKCSFLRMDTCVPAITPSSFSEVASVSASSCSYCNGRSSKPTSF